MPDPVRDPALAAGRHPGSLPDLPPGLLADLYGRKAAYLASARRILNCPAAAEDVVQDVMLRLMAEPPAVPAARQGPYVARMVRNLAIDRARRRHFEARTFPGLDPVIAEAAPDVGDPERAVAASEDLRRACAALDALPEPARTVFRLHRIEGVPQNEIAARLGVSRALVCGLVRRGHLRCLAALDGTCEEGCPLGADGRGAAKAGRRPSVGDEADARA